MDLVAPDHDSEDWNIWLVSKTISIQHDALHETMTFIYHMFANRNVNDLDGEHEGIRMVTYSVPSGNTEAVDLTTET